MAIDIAKFKEAQKPLEERILHALETGSPQAFSIFEIIETVEGLKGEDVLLLVLAEKTLSKDSKTFAKYEQALSKLVSEGKVVTGEVRGSTYYALASKLRELD